MEESIGLITFGKKNGFEQFHSEGIEHFEDTSEGKQLLLHVLQLVFHKIRVFPKSELYRISRITYQGRGYLILLSYGFSLDAFRRAGYHGGALILRHPTPYSDRAVSCVNKLRRIAAHQVAGKKPGLEFPDLKQLEENFSLDYTREFLPASIEPHHREGFVAEISFEELVENLMHIFTLEEGKLRSYISLYTSQSERIQEEIDTEEVDLLSPDLIPQDFSHIEEDDTAIADHYAHQNTFIGGMPTTSDQPSQFIPSTTGESVKDSTDYHALVISPSKDRKGLDHLRQVFSGFRSGQRGNTTKHESRLLYIAGVAILGLLVAIQVYIRLPEGGRSGGKRSSLFQDVNSVRADTKSLENLVSKDCDIDDISYREASTYLSESKRRVEAFQRELQVVHKGNLGTMSELALRQKFFVLQLERYQDKLRTKMENNSYANDCQRNRLDSLNQEIHTFLETYYEVGLRRESYQRVVHRVQKKETLYGISRRYGVKIETIRALNGIDPNNRIDIEQELEIYYPE